MHKEPQASLVTEPSGDETGHRLGYLLGLQLEPQQSWQRFLLGLAMFIVGLAVLMLLGGAHRTLYWLGTAVLCAGFGVAMTGYVGIFLQRFASLRALKQKQVRFDD